MPMAAVLEARRGGGPAPYPHMEYDTMSNPLLSVLGEPPLNSDGTLTVPNGPGIGIDLAPEQLLSWTTSSWVESL